MNRITIWVYFRDGTKIDLEINNIDRVREINNILNKGFTTHLKGIETWYPAHAIDKVTVGKKSIYD